MCRRVLALYAHRLGSRSMNVRQFNASVVGGVLSHNRSTQEALPGDEQPNETNKNNSNDIGSLFAVIRIDTHGCKAAVRENMQLQEAKELEKHFDSLNHHQGYLVVKQEHLFQELRTK